MRCTELTRDGATTIICRPEVLEIVRHVWPCPTCERRTRHVVVYDSSPWYPPYVQCCACGDAWTEGWRHPRPFRPGWRKEAIAKAKHYWANAFRLTEEQRREWFDRWFGTTEKLS